MLKKVSHVRNIISQSAILVKRFEEKLGPCVCVRGWVCARWGETILSSFSFRGDYRSPCAPSPQPLFAFYI